MPLVPLSALYIHCLFMNEHFQGSRKPFPPLMRAPESVDHLFYKSNAYFLVSNKGYISSLSTIRDNI